MDLCRIFAQVGARGLQDAGILVGRACRLDSLALLTVACLLLFADPAAAADIFPRGQGFYFSIPKLVSLIVVYLLWFSICSWVDRDSYGLHLPSEMWNLAMFACGAIGIGLCFTLPFYWLSFVLLLVLFIVPSLIYVNSRNQRVPENEKVLTKAHLADLAERFLKLKFGGGKSEESDAPPIEFLGKSARGEDDEARIARAAASKGYKAAREMVYEALQKRATDIHLEPTKDEMTVRFRVDGILHAADPFSRGMGDAVLNIFKVLGDLDITEKRKPQDGSFSARASGNMIDFRIATAGSVAGEKMVMRILDTSAQIIDLTQLGMREKLRERMNIIADQPHGMLIVCGPTGAGKSTTLYACLNEIDRFQKNVITVENPVEYKIENVTQIEINPKAGKTFAGELRSILRQDPDVIYIGEIRDKETAEIACQAAQTGHMVFTTLHANDTVTALGRLIDLGVQPFMVADAVNAILGQRLVRLLCKKCKVRYKPNPELLRKANLPADKIRFFYRPPETPGEGNENGKDDDEVCDHCGGTGYHSRTGVFELFELTDKLKDLIRDNPNLNAIRQEAIKMGMKSLQEDALRQVIEGKTSIQEMLRVCK